MRLGIVRSSIRISEIQCKSDNSKVSRSTSVNVHPPTTKKPTTISVKTRSHRVSSPIQETGPVPKKLGTLPELETSTLPYGKPFLESPVLRCSSPIGDEGYQGFQLDCQPDQPMRSPPVCDGKDLCKDTERVVMPMVVRCPLYATFSTSIKSTCVHSLRWVLAKMGRKLMKARDNL